MNDTVVFYQLSHKFFQRGQDVPATSKQLIHYTLAIGHHIGVIDCFASKLEVPLARFPDWIAHLPEGEARRKLAGLLRFGEIEISAAHAPLLRPALQAARADMPAEEAAWTGCLDTLLQSIAEEPALYLMVRRR
jgi:hypothetical protein